MKRVPTLNPGNGFLGPMYNGCNSIRPAIFFSKCGKWVVGPELYAREVLAKGGHFSNKRKHKYNTQEIKVFKARSSAIKYFNSLCSEIEAWNESHKAG